MDRASKHQLVTALRQEFEDVSLVVLIHQSGMTVSETSDLRTHIRNEGARFQVIKNRLMRHVVKGTSHEPIDSLLTGPTAFAFSQDPIAAARVVVNFAKDCKKIEVRGGVLNGAFLDAQAIKNLASLPSLDVLRGKIVGILQAPAQKLMSTLGAPASQLARVLSAYSKSDAA
jgi:large subunit ribosomal protein L10